MLLNQFGQDSITRVESAIRYFKAGKPVLLLDDENRENEGDVVIPAEMATPEQINFMIKHCSGIICLCLSEARVNHLELPMMVENNTSHYQTGFTVSIEAKEGVTTGVSAHDRAQTIKVAINDHTGPDDLSKPGHIFPLKARKGGVLQRPGHTEGSVDLALFAGFKPNAVLCELMNPDGSMARLPEIVDFCKKHGLMALTIADIIAYRKERL